MHEPWRMVLLPMPDGSAVPTRVWLPPMSGVAGEAQDGSGGDRHLRLPAQRSGVPTAEPGSA